jgi:hypothetical protein
VIPVDPETPILSFEKMRECIITDLDIIDNFYEQCYKRNKGK